MGTGGFRGSLIGARIYDFSIFSYSHTKLCDHFDDLIVDARCSNQETLFRKTSNLLET